MTQKCPQGVICLSGTSAVCQGLPLFFAGAACQLGFFALPCPVWCFLYEVYQWRPRGRSEASTKRQVDHTAILPKGQGPNNQTVGEPLYYRDNHVAHLVFRREYQRNLSGTALFVGLGARNTPFRRVLMINSPHPCVWLDRTNESYSPFDPRVYELNIGCRHAIVALGSRRWMQHICGNKTVQPETGWVKHSSHCFCNDSTIVTPLLLFGQTEK